MARRALTQLRAAIRAAAQLVDLSFAGLGTIMAILAVLAGALIILGR